DFDSKTGWSDNFSELFVRIESTDESFFITGRAGTGKSTFLKNFASRTKKKFVVLAPTGVAALNVSGQTIHSFFKFPPRIITSSHIKKIENNKIYSRIDCLIIDEASMVRADLMDGIDKFMRLNGRDSRLPFGGVQLLLFGDLFQLPPVANDSEYIFSNYYKSPYFFDAKCFKNLSINAVELSTVYRQSDESFINILNEVRKGCLSPESLEIINSRVSFEKKDAVILTCTNWQASAINNSKLEKLAGKKTVLNGELTGELKDFPVPKDLELKMGAKIMIVKNHPDFSYCNGSVGTVHKIEPDLVTVNIGGAYYGLERHTYEKIKYEYDARTDKITSKVVATFRQFPLKLAYALTIHKSQGQTFDDLIIDFGSGAFAHGQAYVALSRCSSLNGLVLRKPLKMNDIMVDGRVNDFLDNAQKRIDKF
ncbi:MAG: DEAD/DEAH box helicase, partial [Candidatus Nanoarchaeia archaeon]|nr:DEAD/DEAH box helicase [Candidatus Nanoarchaeia archaeon]